MKVTLIRKSYSTKQVIGTAEVRNLSGAFIYAFDTLEPPWKDNQRQVSCIPSGEYKCERWNSQKFGHCWILKDVAGRSFILIHSGNRYTHTLGCILVGQGFTDIDKDGIVDVVNSSATMNKLRQILPNAFHLEIID